MKKFLSLALILSICSACSSSGADKTFAGALLGAGWGAGAGAVAGNQINNTGPGAAVGAGFGLVSGAINGAGLDIEESRRIEQQRELDALQVQVVSNQQRLHTIQKTLDERTIELANSLNGTEIYFDEDRASLRIGSAKALERLAMQIKQNPFITSVEVHAHTDNTGDEDRNERLSSARARTIASFLSNQGVSLDQIRTYSHAAKHPVATNTTQEGRQLNRRAEIVFVP